MVKCNLVLVAFVALVGCRKTTERVAPDASGTLIAVPSTAQPVAIVDAGGDAETSDAGAQESAGPYAELPSVEEMEGEVGSNRVVGFSMDDRYLGYELSTCDPCPAEFHFRGPGVPPLDFAYFYDPTLEDTVREAKTKKNDALVEEKLALLAAPKVRGGRTLRGPFPYADLVFAERSEKDATEHVTLLVGAHVPGEDPVFPLRIALGTHPMSKEIGGAPMHDGVLAYVNVTKDGRDLGAVGIARGDYWWESGGIARMPAAAFAAQVYNDTGMKRLAARKNLAAADLFAKASAAVPDSALFAYNLACAAAREDDPRAEPALARAVGKNAAFKARAQKDPDFDHVRAQAWFTKLVR